MGRLFLVEFNKADPNVHFYVCRACQTHIASTQEFQYHHTLQNGSTGGAFEKVVNVQVDGPERVVGSLTIADVHCTKCGDLLGFKFIEVPESSITVEQNWFQLNMMKLLLWDGHQIVEEIQPNLQQDMQLDPEQQMQLDLEQQMQP